MLRPHEFLDLDNCVIKISAIIIKILKENKIMKYIELYNLTYQINGKDIDYVFISALNFLFLLGKIEYDKESDTLELVE